MHLPTKKTALLAAGLAIALTACRTPPPASPPAPQIVSSARVGGKGIPNGRSDSPAPYWQGPGLQAASDPGYGRSSDRPIRTGPAALRGHLLFLNALRGPDGEPVEYERHGACCPFEDQSLPRGGGLLDVYRVRIDGSTADVLLYVDMYRPGSPQLPRGFTARPQGRDSI